MLLGLGLAMDAFSVSLVCGLREPNMRKSKVSAVAGTFAFFQALMPLIGWMCVRSLAKQFQAFEKFIPWIALLLLVFIGTKMLVEGVKESKECSCCAEQPKSKIGVVALLTQGIATSIDALSVGFTIAHYGVAMAVVCALIIAAVTFALCFAGVLVGEKCGSCFSDKATIAGGVILIVIGIEIFLTGIF